MAGKMKAGWVGLLVVAAVAGCGGQRMQVPTGYAVAEPPLPEPVAAAIPGDLRLSEVLVKDGCYYYLSAGTVFPVVTFAALAAGMPDQPWCVGLGG